MIDQKLLTFLTLCDTLHYRVAAERLHVTQPAVTQHIKALEAEYGCQLFSYHNRTISLTQCGVLLRRYAQEACFRERELREKLALPHEPPLRIGATKTIGAYVLSELLVPYLAEPSHRAEIIVDNTAALLDALDHNELDFALIEGFFDQAAYAHRLFRKEPFLGICAKGHPFAGRDVPFKELFAETLLLREQGSGTRAILEQILQEHNATCSQFSRTVCVNDFSLLASLVAASAGISFVYQAVAVNNPELCTFTLQNCSVIREFNYVYLKNTGIAFKIDYFLGKRAKFLPAD